MPVGLCVFGIASVFGLLVGAGCVSIATCHFCYAVFFYVSTFRLCSAALARRVDSASPRSCSHPLGDFRCLCVVVFVFVITCVKGKQCVSGCAEVSFCSVGSCVGVRVGDSTLARCVGQCSRVATRLRGKVTLDSDFHSRDSGERISPFPHNAVRGVCLV